MLILFFNGCCFNIEVTDDSISSSYDLIYKNETPYVVYIYECKKNMKILDSIIPLRQIHYGPVFRYLFLRVDSSILSKKSIYRNNYASPFYTALKYDSCLIFKIQNKCFVYNGLKKGRSPFIGDVVRKDKCLDERGINIQWERGTGVFDYKRYSYTAYNKLDSTDYTSGVITYTFTPSDTVGSVRCNF